MNNDQTIQVFVTAFEHGAPEHLAKFVAAECKHLFVKS